MRHFLKLNKKRKETIAILDDISILSFLLVVANILSEISERDFVNYVNVTDFQLCDTVCVVINSFAHFI